MNDWLTDIVLASRVKLFYILQLVISWHEPLDAKDLMSRICKFVGCEVIKYSTGKYVNKSSGATIIHHVYSCCSIYCFYFCAASMHLGYFSNPPISLSNPPGKVAARLILKRTDDPSVPPIRRNKASVGLEPCSAALWDVIQLHCIDFSLSWFVFIIIAKVESFSFIWSDAWRRM